MVSRVVQCTKWGLNIPRMRGNHALIYPAGKVRIEAETSLLLDSVAKRAHAASVSLNPIPQSLMAYRNSELCHSYVTCLISFYVPPLSVW
jgi:hypothetical protein